MKSIKQYITNNGDINIYENGLISWNGKDAHLIRSEYYQILRKLKHQDSFLFILYDLLQGLVKTNKIMLKN